MIIRWLNRALTTFEQIYDYYSEINPDYAKKLHAEIMKGIGLIAKFPESAPREQLIVKNKLEFRSLLIQKKYKVVYYIQKDTIYIFDIWDCRRNPKTLR